MERVFGRQYGSNRPEYDADVKVSDFYAGKVTQQTIQDVVEYGILIATIAVVVLIGVTAFGSQILPWFEHLAGRITTTGT